METIIGRFLTPLNSLRTMGERPSRRDDNSRGKVQNVRADSSADSPRQGLPPRGLAGASSQPTTWSRPAEEPAAPSAWRHSATGSAREGVRVGRNSRAARRPPGNLQAGISRKKSGLDRSSFRMAKNGREDATKRLTTKGRRS